MGPKPSHVLHKFQRDWCLNSGSGNLFALVGKLKISPLRVDPLGGETMVPLYKGRGVPSFGLLSRDCLEPQREDTRENAVCSPLGRGVARKTWTTKLNQNCGWGYKSQYSLFLLQWEKVIILWSKFYSLSYGNYVIQKLLFKEISPWVMFLECANDYLCLGWRVMCFAGANQFGPGVGHVREKVVPCLVVRDNPSFFLDHE